MKILRRISLIVGFLLLGGCVFRSFAIYNSFTRHRQLYATYSSPWYTDIIITIIITLALIAVIAVVNFIVGFIIKKRNNRSNK